jgi:hypothetical protein
MAFFTTEQEEQEELPEKRHFVPFVFFVVKILSNHETH